MPSQNQTICAAVAVFVVASLFHNGLLCASFFSIIIGFAAYKILPLVETPPVPKLENTWWGPGEEVQETSEIEDFKIEVPDSVLNDLKHRLDNARPFSPPLKNVGQEYGMNTVLLKEFIEFWRTKYNWKEREAFLNQYKHYKVKIQGLKIHYVRVPANVTKNEKVRPLLLLHGWPGSFREFYETIPYFTNVQKDRDFVFELIIPSLPGFNFSDATDKTGLGAAQMSVIMKNLMQRLGFDRFYVQGGDWGAIVAHNVATLYPENVIGIHSNLPICSSLRAKFLIMVGMVFPNLIVEEKFRDWMYPQKYTYEETGYMHLQSTKPDSLGVALNDSPVGLAAYIIEKIITWTNFTYKKREDGGLQESWPYEKLIDNLMLYWITGCVTSSMRIYAETFNKPKVKLGIERIPIKVPSGAARYRYDIIYMPDLILKEKFENLVHSSDIEAGHFAAMQVPEIFAKDVIEFVGKVEAITNNQN